MIDLKNPTLSRCAKCEFKKRKTGVFLVVATQVNLIESQIYVNKSLH